MLLSILCLSYHCVSEADNFIYRFHTSTDRKEFCPNILMFDLDVLTRWDLGLFEGGWNLKLILEWGCWDGVNVFCMWDRLIFKCQQADYTRLKCPPKIHIYLEPQNVDLSGNRVFPSIISKIKSSWISVALIQELVFYKEEKTETQGQTLRGQVQAKMEAETGVTHLQAKEHQECWPLPEARGD